MKIGFVGFGHMAQVLFIAMDRAKVISRSKILFTRQDQKKAKLNEQEFGITSTSLENLVKECDLLLLCVKPQQAEKVLADLKTYGIAGKALVSVLAGTKISDLEKCGARVIRTMPNLCSAALEGMTLMCRGTTADLALLDYVKELFGCCGRVAVIEEDLMNIGSAMAGSGPGFVFRLIDAMALSGEEKGMSREEALKIAAQTFLGAAKLILEGANPAVLAIQIATPNGMTEAGFKSMDQNDVVNGMKKAIGAAAKRSAELSCINHQK